MATITATHDDHDNHQPQYKLHIVFFPIMSHGHMLPMFDIARLFAARDLKSTFITTPANVSLFSNKIHRDRADLGLDITIQTIHFPYNQVGLPPGFESFKSITSPEMAKKLFKAFDLFDRDLELILQELRPDCIVADLFFPWATELAAKFNIPRIVFHGSSFFYTCVEHGIRTYKPHKNVSSDAESFVVPDLPEQIELTKIVLAESSDEFWNKIRESEAKSFGTIFNSFYELEPNYSDHYKKKLGQKAWAIGPVSLSNKSVIDKVERGEKGGVLTDDDEHCRLIGWLNSQKPNSVLYVSFGSGSRFSKAQLGEIAMGLEASSVPFMWVVRTSSSSLSSDSTNNFVEEFLPDGFKERNKGKGFIILDWAPQMLILEHKAVGGFFTHCGWNSITEAVCAGVPMITWPLYAEQFYNEKFATDVSRIGIRVGVEKRGSWTDEIDSCVRRDKVERAVAWLMGGGDEAEKMRARTRELGEMARRAVEEISGSSYLQISALIEELKATRSDWPH